MKLIKQFIAMFVAVFLITQATGLSYAEETLSSVKLSPLVVSFTISLFIPLITGLLSKATWSSGTKGLITLVLTMGQTLIVQNTMVDGSAFFTQETLLAFALSLAIAVGSYAGVYKPLQITSSPVTNSVGQRVPGKLSNVGVS